MTHAHFGRMTLAQRAVMNKLNDRTEEQLLAAIAEAREAYNAIVKLPALNESGESVVHGCNVAMHNVIEDYMKIVRVWYFRLRMIDDDKATKIWMDNLDLWKL